MHAKSALVIGGTSGLGFGITQALTKRDIFTYSLGRRSVNPLNFTNIDPKKVKFIRADITNKSCILLIKNTLGKNKLDYIVVSSATEAPLKIFTKIRRAEYDYAFLVNLNAPFFIIQSLLPFLNNKARLLFISSRLATSPEVGSLVYAMTKAALETFSKGLTKEFSGKFLSSSVNPGLVDTEMQERLRKSDPALFPPTDFYKGLKPHLKSSFDVGSDIVSYLCDTTDKNFLAMMLA